MHLIPQRQNPDAERKGKDMLQGLFNYDNPVWRFIGKLGDLIILNILWTICSIPIFTIGASTTAVYYMTLKLVRDEDGSTIKGFFHSFKENFKQATIIWLILLVAGLLLAFDFWFFFTGQMVSVTGMVKMFCLAIFGGLFLLFLFIFTYVFPLQSRFYNSVKRTLFNAFFMSVRHLFQTIGIIVIDIAIVAGSILGFLFVPQVSMLLFLFGMPLIAFVNSFFFTAIFQKYMPKKQTTDSEINPLFDEENKEVEEAIENLKGR